MKIIVIGEICYDNFIYGEVKRLSPEAPVPVFTPINEINNLGMAGNVRQNLWAMNPNLKIGLYHQQKTIKKTRYVDQKSNHMFIRVDEGEDNIDSHYLNDEIILEIKQSDALIISDYNKGFLLYNGIKNITKMSNFCVLDTKRKIDHNLIEDVDFVKLNEDEFNKSKENITEDLLSKIIITMGPKGAKYMDKVYPVNNPKETIDVSGAGDTFTAAFTLKYLETKNVEESIIHANQMASIVVSKRGVATP
jgi:D-beta-D-heptose 7-phosphate kinase/D-beta-D-heptose 1-phosphate adenosyltransferase